MKKRYIAVLLLLILVLSACGTAELPWETSKASLSVDAADGSIVMEFSEGTLTPTGGELAVRNKGTEELSFGSEYSIQLHRGGTWYDIDVKSPDWTAVEYVVMPGEDFSEKLDWSSFYGELPAGDYRIIKTFCQGGQNFRIAHEFSIS